VAAVADFDELLAALKKAGAALRDADVPYAVGGGFAAWALGASARDHDVDLMVKEEDAERALKVLEDAGFRGERPPEGWLLKAFDGDAMVDLIFKPAGFAITDEVLARCVPADFEAMEAPALPIEDVLVSKLLSLTEHALDYEGLLELSRALREKIDWDEVRTRTEESPFARAFFTMAEGLGLLG
jgi:hypothetical protein